MGNLAVTYSSDMAFSALADPTRRAVLDLLLQGRLPAGQIARAFPVSRPAVSKHLRILKRARLVRTQRDGRQHLFELSPGALRTVDLWLSRYRAFWKGELANLKHFVESAQAREMPGQRKKAARKKHVGGKHGSTSTNPKRRRNR